MTSKIKIVQRNDGAYHVLVNDCYRVWKKTESECIEWQKKLYPNATVEHESERNTSGETWLIQYDNDEHPTIKVHGYLMKAEAVAAKRNKYGESFTIVAAPPEDRSVDKQWALAEAIKYGCSTQGMR